ncbi:hypothetical protein [Bradyrhizobium sp. C9]|uniref:hypothetical protein n=1 Tax=Bradyrhizobium sp. C9 TaxID=142585 RepID=UPI001177C5F5|nr:hypothetical protein [Bradyrhizobium sp. C9]
MEVTFNAVTKRFGRRFWHEGRSIAKATKRETANGYGPYQLLFNGTTIIDCGDLDRINDWCADVMTRNERIIDVRRGM